VARYLVLWRRSPTAWPTDPVEYSKLVMKIGPLVDDSIKKGEIIEHGHFLDGTSGYSIFQAEAADLLRFWSMLVPYYENEIHEFIPYDKSREILGAIFKVPAETAKK
jgi:hypothetical protein